MTAHRTLLRSRCAAKELLTTLVLAVHVDAKNGKPKCLGQRDEWANSSIRVGVRVYVHLGHPLANHVAPNQVVLAFLYGLEHPEEVPPSTELPVGGRNGNRR